MLFNELWRIWKGNVLACFYVICPIDARKDFEHWRARASLCEVEIDYKLMGVVKKSIRIANQVKKRRLNAISDLRARKTRARTLTRIKY